MIVPVEGSEGGDRAGFDEEAGDGGVAMEACQVQGGVAGVGLGVDVRPVVEEKAGQVQLVSPPYAARRVEGCSTPRVPCVDVGTLLKEELGGVQVTVGTGLVEGGAAVVLPSCVYLCSFLQEEVDGSSVTGLARCV